MTKHEASAPGVDLDDETDLTDELESADDLETKLETILDENEDEDDGCPKGDPECVSRADESHDACEAPFDPGIIGSEVIHSLPIDAIDPDPEQPREAVDDELWASIRENGVLQPILVRPHPSDENRRMIVDGERRWRGARKAGLSTIPAREMSSVDNNGDRLLRQVVFNDGKRLTPMEEAKAWKRIMVEKSWTAQQLAKAIGRGKSTVSDRLALLDAPEAFQPFFLDGTLTAAAAPIVRKYSTVPPAILAKIIEHAGLSGMRASFAREGKTIPLQDVEDSLKSSLGYPFPEVAGPYAKEFTGESFEIGGKTYAADYNTYQKHLRAHEPKAKTTSAPAYDWQEENRKRQEKMEQVKKLRRAQVFEIAVKLPAEFSASWMAVLVAHLIDDVELAELSALMGIEPPAKLTPSGSEFKRLVLARIKKMNAKELQRLCFQILLANEIRGFGDAEELQTFAKLTRVDLKKVKPPVDEKSKVAPAKKSPAKSTKASTSKKRT